MSSFVYILKDIKPNEVQFIMEAISNVPAPMVMSGPIYNKIKDQIDAQNAAFLEAQKKENQKVDPATENKPAAAAANKRSRTK
jgi:hypothetical protein